MDGVYDYDIDDYDDMERLRPFLLRVVLMRCIDGSGQCFGRCGKERVLRNGERRRGCWGLGGGEREQEQKPCSQTKERGELYESTASRKGRRPEKRLLPVQVVAQSYIPMTMVSTG